MEGARKNNLAHQPTDCLLHIFRFLPVKDLKQCRLVCWDLREVLDTEPYAWSLKAVSCQHSIDLFTTSHKQWNDNAEYQVNQNVAADIKPTLRERANGDHLVVYTPRNPKGEWHHALYVSQQHDKEKEVVYILNQEIKRTSIEQWNETFSLLNGTHGILQYDSKTADQQAVRIATQCVSLAEIRNLPQSWFGNDSAAFVVFCKTLSEKCDEIVINSVTSAARKLQTLREAYASFV